MAVLDRRQMILALATLPLLGSNPSRALAAKPVLRVTGGASGAPVTFDAAGLDALPQTRFVTTTPWNAQPVEFRGVSARDLFQAAGVQGEHLQLIALNDYVVEAKTSDILAGDGLFATHQDGVPMPVSAKGPVFLMFPFDQRPELKHQSYYSRSVWQLAEVVVTS